MLNCFLNIYNLDLQSNEEVKLLLGSTNSLSNLPKVRNSKLPVILPCGEELIYQPRILIELMHKLLIQLLSDASKLIETKSKEGESTFSIRNNTQFFMARTLSLVYIKASILDKFVKYLEGPEWRSEEKILMTKLSTLYGLWCLEEHSSSLLRYFY